MIGIGLYYANLGNTPNLIINKKSNSYFDIWDTGSYVAIGYNFKENHFIRLYFNSSTILGDNNFIKDS